MGDPTSSYTTTGIAFRVLGALRPHHHNKVETPSVGKCKVMDIAVRCILKSGDKIINCICTFCSFVRIKEEKMSQPLTVENNSMLMSP
jgi:hypothetical protein